MTVLYVKLLGQLECRLPSGTIVNLSTRKSEVLLAYLSLTPSVRQPREKLTSLLWSDRSEAQARNSLRQTLSLIKKAFKNDFPNLLEIDRTTVTLPASHIRVDVNEFEGLLADPSRDNLSKAIEIYRDELLEGISIRDIACQEWLANERDRLRRLVVEALASLNRMQLAEFQYLEAIESAKRLLAFDPLQEHGWRQLMLSYYLNDDRNHGLQAFQRCRNILQTELGVEPEPKTRELYEQLRQSDLSAVNLELVEAKVKPDGRPEDLKDRSSELLAARKQPDDATSSSVNIKSHDYFMQGWYHAIKHNPRDSAMAIEQFKKCIETDPANASAHAILALEYNVERYENWSANRELSLNLSRQHLEKALEFDPDSDLAHVFMAEYCLFIRDFGRASFHADKAVSLNPDPDSYSMKALVLASTRQYEEAKKYADLCLQLDPHHPYSGWASGSVYRYVGSYDLAVRTLRRIPNPPPSVYGEIAASYIGMRENEEARIAMAQYHNLAREQMPDYPTTRKAWHSLWYENISYQFDEDFEQFFEMLIQAGLCDEISDHSQVVPSIAVLPFENLSRDMNQAYFSDGITSDIISILSRVKEMRVVARYSTLQYKNNVVAVKEISEQQNVRYLLGGSVRTSGNTIRVNVELIDTHTTENCWAEQYDRELDDVFAVQDDITRNIVKAIKVHFSGSDVDLLHSQGTQNLKAWKLCLLASDLQDSYIKENVHEARRLVKKALQLDPNYCYASVILGWTYWQEVFCGWSNSVDSSLKKANDGAQSALKLDPNFAGAWALVGLISVMRHQPQKAIDACMKAISLEPGNAEVQAIFACVMCYAGQYDKAETAHMVSLELCPSSPNWYILTGGIIDMSAGKVSQAIEKFQKGIEVEPDSPLCRYYLVDAFVEAGEIDNARKVVDEINALDQSFSTAGLIRMQSKESKERERLKNNLKVAGLYP